MSEEQEEKIRILKIFVKTLHGELIDLRLIDTLEKDEGFNQHAMTQFYRVVINRTDDTEAVDYKNKAWIFESPQQRDFFYNDLIRKIESLPTIMVL